MKLNYDRVEKFGEINRTVSATVRNLLHSEGILEHNLTTVQRRSIRQLEVDLADTLENIVSATAREDVARFFVQRDSYEHDGFEMGKAFCTVINEKDYRMVDAMMCAFSEIQQKASEDSNYAVLFNVLHDCATIVHTDDEIDTW